MQPNPTKQLRQQANQPTNLIEALADLLNTYTKNDQQQQHQHQHPQYPQQHNREKSPAHGRGFQRKGVPQEEH